MVVLSKYFFRFFIYCVILTMMVGVIAALTPSFVGQVLTAFPFLIAMILVLFHFIRKEQRAPTPSERNKIALGYSLIFFSYNMLFALLGPLIFNWKEDNIVQVWLQFISHKQFLFQLIAQLMMYMIPLYIITFWFYGKQAERMANKILGT
ncbi:hypothetical protein AMD27_03720 [Acinetobacter sp. TGL-Y2]|uniref:ABZJ_00895 family protein n=1 Tax=Acinetobacter sp. TGL-Y2 TaxID=1407071 RepID=UPI0007A65D19|nr:ABZJ_00895 family protein [Acinetobacter sp. TGL-Y2]AMW78088.1 hypothetical protein AMD27_03720 [Acinetobacter sp. TGL-Y2]